MVAPGEALHQPFTVQSLECSASRPTTAIDTSSLLLLQTSNEKKLSSSFAESCGSSRDGCGSRCCREFLRDDFAVVWRPILADAAETPSFVEMFGDKSDFRLASGRFCRFAPVLTTNFGGRVPSLVDRRVRFLVHTRSLAGAADRSGGELRVGRRQTAQRVVGSEQPVYSALYLTRRMATRRPWAVPRSRRWHSSLPR